MKILVESQTAERNHTLRSLRTATFDGPVPVEALNKELLDETHGSSIFDPEAVQANQMASEEVSQDLQPDEGEMAAGGTVLNEDDDRGISGAESDGNAQA